MNGNRRIIPNARQELLPIREQGEDYAVFPDYNDSPPPRRLETKNRRSLNRMGNGKNKNTKRGNRNDGEVCQCGLGRPTNPAKKTSKNRRINKIVNGYDPGYPRPWVVVIRVGRNQGQCGGSIINHRYIITASHCFCYDNGKEEFLCR